MMHHRLVRWCYLESKPRVKNRDTLTCSNFNEEGWRKVNSGDGVTRREDFIFLHLQDYVNISFCIILFYAA